MSNGYVNSSSGQMRPASSAKLDQNREFFESKLPALCAEHTARNKYARENRGTVTGRRPAGLPMEDWIKQISGGGRRRGVAAPESQDEVTA